MDKDNPNFLKIKNMVGPMDRIFRSFIGLMGLVTAYSLDLNILDFAIMHIITVYLWVTGLTGWDPFYAITKTAWNSAKDNLAINGRFRL